MRTPPTRSPAENLSAIAIFVCVGQSTSFTSAARGLRMTASGVSKAISRLEERLGVRLVNRTTRSINLTDEGTIYLERCRQILAEIDDAEAAIVQSQSQPRGRIRVQLPRGIGRKVIVPALARFYERYPEVVVDVFLDGRFLNLAEEGIDVALRFGEPEDSAYVARKLCRVKYGVCASPDYLHRYGEPKTPDDLFRHRCVTYLSPQTGRHRPWELRRNKEKLTVKLSGSLNVNEVGALFDAAVAGVGLAYLPDFMIADAVASKTIEPVMLDYVYEGARLRMLYSPSRHLPARLRAFIDFIRELLPSEPPWRGCF